jgi:hypothetical protein
VLNNDAYPGKTWPLSVGSSFRGHSLLDVSYRFDVEDTVMETDERDEDIRLLRGLDIGQNTWIRARKPI